MANMSYCRFQNTVRDLEECVELLEFGEAEDGDLSPDEIRAKNYLIKLCERVVEHVLDNQ